MCEHITTIESKWNPHIEHVWFPWHPGRAWSNSTCLWTVKIWLSSPTIRAFVNVLQDLQYFPDLRRVRGEMGVVRGGVGHRHQWDTFAAVIWVIAIREPTFQQQGVTYLAGNSKWKGDIQCLAYWHFLLFDIPIWPNIAVMSSASSSSVAGCNSAASLSMW